MQNPVPKMLYTAALLAAVLFLLSPAANAATLQIGGMSAHATKSPMYTKALSKW